MSSRLACFSLPSKKMKKVKASQGCGGLSPMSVQSSTNGEDNRAESRKGRSEDGVLPPRIRYISIVAEVSDSGGPGCIGAWWLSLDRPGFDCWVPECG